MELDLSSYATKTDLKNVTYVDVINFALKTNLTSLKTEVDKLDIAKLTPVTDNLAKLRNVVKIDVEYDKLVAKVNNIDTTNFVKKTKMKRMDQILERKLVIWTKKYLILVVWLKKQISILKLLK